MTAAAFQGSIVTETFAITWQGWMLALTMQQPGVKRGYIHVRLRDSQVLVVYDIVLVNNETSLAQVWQALESCPHFSFDRLVEEGLFDQLGVQLTERSEHLIGDSNEI